MKRCFHDFDSIPLHVVNKCPYPEWPVRKQQVAWEIFGNAIDSFNHTYNLRTHAFVLMSNHYHWLCSTSDKDLDWPGLFDWFDMVVSAEFFLNEDFVNPDPKSEFVLYDHHPEFFVLDHIEAYRNAYAYIYRNPVEAGLVKRAEDYLYSTLHYILGKSKKKMQFCCFDDMNVILDPHRVLGFINEQSESISGNAL